MQTKQTEKQDRVKQIIRIYVSSGVKEFYRPGGAVRDLFYKICLNERLVGLFYTLYSWRTLKVKKGAFWKCVELSKNEWQKEKGDAASKSSSQTTNGQQISSLSSSLPVGDQKSGKSSQLACLLYVDVVNKSAERSNTTNPGCHHVFCSLQVKVSRLTGQKQPARPN